MVRDKSANVPEAATTARRETPRRRGKEKTSRELFLTVSKVYFIIGILRTGLSSQGRLLEFKRKKCM